MFCLTQANVFDEQGFAKWPNGKTFALQSNFKCLTSKLDRLAKA